MMQRLLRAYNTTQKRDILRAQAVNVAVLHRSKIREAAAAIASTDASQGRKVQRLIRREWLQKLSLRGQAAAAAEAEFDHYQSEFMRLKVCILIL